MINLSTLSYKDKIDINEKPIYDESYLSLTNIKDLKNVEANGFVFQNEVDELKIRITCKGTMYLEDSITLDVIPYDFEFEYDDDIPENCIKNENMLDINEFLWQNIVLEVPMRFTSHDAEGLAGENWKVKNEDTEEEIDPRMAKLLDYNKGGE